MVVSISQTGKLSLRRIKSHSHAELGSNQESFSAILVPKCRAGYICGDAKIGEAALCPECVSDPTVHRQEATTGGQPSPRKAAYWLKIGFGNKISLRKSIIK